MKNVGPPCPYKKKPQSVDPKNVKLPASVADAVRATPAADQKAIDTEDKEQFAATGTVEQIGKSASMTGSHWATLGALVGTVVLIA
ncbi:hypothetical protein BG003_006823 [Podila horticola]|nr:hypothetical protein BG003_006823 [Podila horticola]